MSKTEIDTQTAAAPEIEPAPIHSIYIAEGTGKTAQNAGAKAKEVHNAELFAAIQEANIPRWSKSSIHLYFCIFIAFCSSYANGYDGSIFSSILGMAQFQKAIPIGTDGSKVSIVTSLYNVGSIVTTPVAALVSDRFGRRMGMLTGAIGIIIGSIITATSTTMAQLTVGRFVLGSGVQFMTVAAPAYAIEIAPPHWRGRCTGLYNCGWFAGSIPAACISYGTQFINSNYAWKVPLILQNIASVIVVFSVWFIPESPRYLFSKGREDEGSEFLVKYHGNGNAQARLVLLEIEEIRESIRQDAADKATPWWDYSPFLTHNGRWRAAQAIMMGVFGQFSGNGLGYFNVQIYKLIGVDSQSQQLGYQILYQVVGAIGALTAVSLTDRMNRRPVLIYGTLGVAVLLAINAGLTNAIANNKAANDGVVTNVNYARGALAFYFLFQAFFSFTYTPLQGVVPAEALDTTLRAKGLALYGAAVGAVGFINTYAGPIALANITYKYIYVFVGWDLVEAVLWYFFCVEAQGRSLEELEWVYNQPNPVKASQKVDKVVLQADGTVSEKIVEHAE